MKLKHNEALKRRDERVIAGYGNPRIRAAADAQRERLDIATWHNMFLSVAHTESDIEQALAGTAKAFQALG